MTCAHCPRREAWERDPETYALCVGCTPLGNEGKGKECWCNNPVPHLRCSLLPDSHGSEVVR
jgi:hypothetical protein